MDDLYESTQKSASEQTVSLNVRMPLSMRTAFAALCASHQVEPSKVIRRFIKAELSKQEK